MSELKMISILSRWSSARVLWSGEAESIGDAVKRALASDANLVDAYLTGADLTGADLTGADLTDADLTGAYLTDADLTGAYLTGADLTGAYLTDADLTGAYLAGANLAGANLAGANLADANITAIRYDIFAILDAAPAEVPALALALKEGRVNGSVYEGNCACLLGTIANARGCTYDALGIQPDSDRPAERFFMNISPGHTPDINPVAKLALGWVEEWTAKRAKMAEVAT